LPLFTTERTSWRTVGQTNPRAAGSFP
jgi:hypothetical protein